MLVNRHDEQTAGRDRGIGRARLVRRGGAGVLRSEVLDRVDRQHASPPAVDRDLEIVRAEVREGVPLFVDDLHVDGEDLHSRFDPGRSLVLPGEGAHGQEERHQHCHVGP